MRNGHLLSCSSIAGPQTGHKRERAAKREENSAVGSKTGGCATHSALLSLPMNPPFPSHPCYCLFPTLTHVTGLKGRLLRSDCDCSMLIDWFRASSWRERFGDVMKSGKPRLSPSHCLPNPSCTTNTQCLTWCGSGRG